MIEEHLQGLSGEGRIDSSGRFTLDARLAEEKLARFRLRDPGHFVLHLAASAVAAGAAEVSFRAESPGLVFRHDGETPSFAEFTQLLNVLVPAQLELAIALQALRQRGQQVTIQVPGAEVKVTPRSLLIEPRENAPGLVMRLGKVGVSSWIRSIFHSDVPEFALLKEHFLYCPVPLRLGGELCNRPWPGRGWSSRPTPPWPLRELAWESRSEPAWGWAGGFQSVAPLTGANLEVVLHGRSFTAHEPRLGGRVLVYSESLRTDLSQQQIVQDDLYRAMVEELENLGNSNCPGTSIPNL